MRVHITSTLARGTCLHPYTHFRSPHRPAGQVCQLVGSVLPWQWSSLVGATLPNHRRGLPRIDVIDKKQEQHYGHQAKS